MSFPCVWRVLAPGIACVLGLLVAPAPAASVAADVTAERAAFTRAYAAARQGDDAWRTLAAGLADYPLYPYLEAAALEHDVRRVDAATVRAYLERYPGWIPAADLRRAYLLELARRADWPTFQTLYQPGLGTALACAALEARLATGGAALDFTADLASLWEKAALPSACDPVLAAAHDQGLLTVPRLWARVDRAAAANQPGTIAALAAWLPAEDAAAALRFVQALRDPSAALAAASAWPGTARSTQAATLALTRLARRQTDAADSAWQGLRPRLPFTADERGQVEYALALYHATDFDAGALAALSALPAALQTQATREWRARLALARQDWPAVLAAIAAMPPAEQRDGEWRYFKARALAAGGQGDAAKAAYAALADEATYFGFLASDRLDESYAICPSTVTPDPRRVQAVLDNPGLVRAFELQAVDLPAYARREWARAAQGLDAATMQQAVLLANQRGWYDRAVFALSSGPALRMYDLRFPLASQDGLVLQAQEAGIYPPWAYGILRAESAWVSDARSGADARGLMQLIPDTAAKVARTNGLPWGGPQSLYDPEVNIALGTRYLAEVAARFSGSPWLASAAYNAGPNRVDQWVAARGTLAPDVFVATIPFKETREYVARVMAFSVIYDWRLHGSVVPLAARMPPIGQAWTVPGADTPRVAVTCPAAAAAATGGSGGRD